MQNKAHRKREKRREIYLFKNGLFDPPHHSSHAPFGVAYFLLSACGSRCSVFQNCDTTRRMCAYLLEAAGNCDRWWQKGMALLPHLPFLLYDSSSRARRTLSTCAAPSEYPTMDRRAYHLRAFYLELIEHVDYHKTNIYLSFLCVSMQNTHYVPFRWSDVLLLLLFTDSPSYISADSFCDHTRCGVLGSFCCFAAAASSLAVASLIAATKAIVNKQKIGNNTLTKAFHE